MELVGSDASIEPESAGRRAGTRMRIRAPRKGGLPLARGHRLRSSNAASSSRSRGVKARIWPPCATICESAPLGSDGATGRRRSSEQPGAAGRGRRLLWPRSGTAVSYWCPYINRCARRQPRYWTDRCSSAPSTAAFCMNSWCRAPSWAAWLRRLRRCSSRRGISGRS